MDLSLNVIGERLGLDQSCIRICRRQARRFSGVRLYDPARGALRPGLIYVIEPDRVSPELLREDCGFALCAMPERSMGGCDYLYMDIPVTPAELLSQIQSIFEVLGAWEDGFAHRLIACRDIRTLAEPISEALAHPFYAVDSSFRVLIQSNHPEMTNISVSWRYFWEHKYLPLDLVERMFETGDIERFRALPEAALCRSRNFYHPFITCPLRCGERWIGFLFVIGIYQNVTAADIELADHIGRLLALYMGASGTGGAGGPVYEDFFRDALRGELRSEARIRQQLATFGWREGDAYCLMRIPMEEDYRCRLNFSAELEKHLDARSVYVPGGLVCVIHIGKMRDYAEVCRALRLHVESLRRGGAVSEPFAGFRRISEFYYQVRDAAPSDGIVLFRETLAERLAAGERPADVTTMCVQTLFEMRDYDSRHATEFYETLRIYLECERSLVDAAARLYIHRNTLIRRVEKLEELFGELELDDPAVRLALLLSFKIIASSDKTGAQK